LRIPVFVSSPTILNKSQNDIKNVIIKELKNLNLEPRSIGKSDYPTDYPLREVLVLAKHCSGGVILGFEQFASQKGISNRGAESEKSISEEVIFPTPWNQLEAGILFGLDLPLLIFRESSLRGGVFDVGVTDLFIHNMPTLPILPKQKGELKELILKWQAKVRANYYR
jgi:hypothetical protein